MSRFAFDIRECSIPARSDFDPATVARHAALHPVTEISEATGQNEPEEEYEETPNAGD